MSTPPPPLPPELRDALADVLASTPQASSADLLLALIEIETLRAENQRLRSIAAAAQERVDALVAAAAQAPDERGRKP